MITTFEQINSLWDSKQWGNHSSAIVTDEGVAYEIILSEKWLSLYTQKGIIEYAVDVYHGSLFFVLYDIVTD